MKTQAALLLLQAFQVLFLWGHDWVPLGRMNDVVAVRAEDSRTKLVIVTVLQSLPYTLGLLFSLHFAGAPWPQWVRNYLWISYGILLLGQLRAWWIPYLLRPEPAHAARFHAMFGRTHTFLPVRNGMVPNTAHMLLHAATVATLLLLVAG